jgi:opacity protein-like surface antigen
MLTEMRSLWLPRAAGVALAIGLLVPRTASADVTGFFGTNRTPTDRSVKGFAIGTGFLVAGVEFEYADTKQDVLDAAPQLRTYMFNGLAQTPIPIARMQFYATAGGGVYRETLSDASETHVGINLGGGVKATLLGPLRLRLDYRIFTLRGAPLHAKLHRFYAGINLKF